MKLSNIICPKLKPKRVYIFLVVICCTSIFFIQLKTQALASVQFVRLPPVHGFQTFFEPDIRQVRQPHNSSSHATLPLASPFAATPTSSVLRGGTPINSFPTFCIGRSTFSFHSINKEPRAPSLRELRSAFESLVNKYLAPWIPFQMKSTEALLRPISTQLLNSIEGLLHGGAFRVLLPGDGTVRYRLAEHWTQTYRVNRMLWTLQTLQRVARLDPGLRVEFFVNVADAPRSTMDSMSHKMGGLPIFSFRSSPAYLDIPVPDPAEYGAGGDYTPRVGTVPFKSRVPRLVFRGSSSSLAGYHNDNWLVVPRIRLAALSRAHPRLIDAGITRWIKLVGGTTSSEIEASLNVSSVAVLSPDAQTGFKYILDVDGGLGSSRKRGILASGSVPLFQSSHWHAWYEPLLKPFIHYVPVDPFLHGLIARISELQTDEAFAHSIAQHASCFAQSVTSEDAALLYWHLLLQQYSRLLRQPPKYTVRVSPSLCKMRPVTAHGPMGCYEGWYTFNGTLPFGCRFTGAKPHATFQYECWRHIGREVEFKFTNDPVHDPYT